MASQRSPSTSSKEEEVASKPAVADEEPVQEETVDETAENTSSNGEPEEAAAKSTQASNIEDAPPLPTESVPDGPPLPNEPAPAQQDDGWDCQWDPSSQAWFFYNRFTGKTQWDNPRILAESSNAVVEPAGASEIDGPQPPASEQPPVLGYNPAIHGDYDANAWYAKGDNPDNVDGSSSLDADALADQAALYASTATFNRFTGQFQTEDMGPDRHNDEAKSRRQMNAYFDVDAAANSHDGRSLKAERSNKKPSKSELKQFKEKRRARKEEKRRAWLRD
jgi:hypothetical protein